MDKEGKKGYDAYMERSSRTLNIVRVIVLVLLTVMFIYLFYNQASGEFESDMAAHIRRALAEGKSTYSVVQAMLGFSYTNGGPMGAAVFLTVIEIATIVVSEQFMRRLLPNVRPEAVFVLALAVNFVGAVYLPVISPHFTKGVSVANVWHNPTYLGMRLASLCALWAFLRFIDVLESKNKFVDWAVFSVFLIMSASIKPSFVIVFGPVVVVWCVIALVREGVGTLKRSLALSVPFFIILGILFYQYTILFTEVPSTGIGFGFAVVWRYTDAHFPLGMIQSYLFPIFVFIACWKKNKGDFNYVLSLAMFVVALCIFLFVNETGPRMYHGNFGWSLKFAVYYLFITSIVVFVRTYGHKFPILIAPAAVPEGGEESGKTLSPVVEDSSEGSSEAAPAGSAADSVPIASTEAATAEVEPGASASSRPSFWPEVFVSLLFAAHLLSGLAYLVRALLGRGF